jgi:hypothetical protein
MIHKLSGSRKIIKMVHFIIDGKKRTLDVKEEFLNTFRVKMLIELYFHIPVSEQKLFYEGKILKDDSFVLKEYQDKTIMVMRAETEDDDLVKEKEECHSIECKFWGSNKLDGLCSQCHSVKVTLEKEKIEKEKIEKERAEKAEKEEKEKLEKEKEILIKSICKKCKTKKRSYMIMKCKCENYFCQKHIFSGNHDCQYDYIGNKKKQTEDDNENPKTKKLKTACISQGGNTCY